MGGGKGGGGTTATSTVNVHSDPTTVDVLGLDDLKADLTLHLPQPLTTDSTSTATTTSTSTIDVKPVSSSTHLSVDPLTTTSNLNVDLKPAVVDLCVTANVGHVPNLCVRQPYHHHVGFTLFGAEIWGLTFAGEQKTTVEELGSPARVAWGGSASWPPRPAPPPRPAERQAGGLRIRLGS